ncbi:N-acetylneuraminate synthase family protein [Propionivibrio sp.]|uniref:N-acetylneuraminate synthase family protein n=1 Tax=Propionivibrio sp. TaxID=2212460 RepID=UPI003BEFB013
MPCYKIASFEMTDLPLVRKVAATGKPMSISTGMATAAEIDETVRTARSTGCHDVVLLKCTSTYPASPINTNLSTIPHLLQLTNCKVGLSDHTMGIGVSVSAFALGATVIEKFTSARSVGGVDAAFSIEPAELKSLVEETERAWRALGQVRYGACSEAEQKSLAFRRSIYACRDITTDESFTAENIRIIRPGFGLPPRYLEMCIGRKARCPIKGCTPIAWNLLA